LNMQVNFFRSFRSLAQTFAFLFATAVVLPGQAFGVIIYDNGNLGTGPTTDSGVAAPAGTQWSEVQHEYGNLTGSNTNAGFGCQRISTTTSNRCADDFNVPVGETWTIDKVVVFAYQTGFANPTTSPFVAGFLQIWSGRPGDPGSTVVFGDLTMNRLGTATNSGMFRIFNTVAPPPGSAPGTTRIIWRIELNVSPGLALTNGNYWVDFQLDAGANGNFVPTTTTVGTRAVPFSNGRQFITNTVWGDALDAGNPAALVDVIHDFPFKLDGTVSGAPAVPRSRTGDYDGDNKTDPAVARSGSSVAQSTWYIRNSQNGSITGSQWGVGVGFGGSGDRAATADYDGDGKTDIAVWRPGAATVAAFFILNSSNNTLSIIPFGQTGDDSAVVGDYDGDGRADAAVYRDGGGGQSFFFYRASNNNPGGNVTYVPFGIGGDRAIQGDFTGDGRYDFQVARNNGGNANIYRMVNGTGAVSAFQYGLFTDRFVSGDFDADNRADLAAIRSNGAAWDWYVWMTGNNRVFVEKFGATATDFVTPGDYDGDEKWDIAVWRSGAADARFFTRNTFASPFTTPWGTSTAPLTAPDYPIQAYLVK
jgi:hypothetical protein